MKLTIGEKDLIIALLESHLSTIQMLIGFGKPTKKQREQKEYYKKLVEKIVKN